ncbi:MAG TPA: YigZ family protein [Candidatus Avamphibacillus intestinigallinarum]|nr:YigZ family protein [Candidatus Avamphibacillus intestinigallinarum]
MESCYLTVRPSGQAEQMIQKSRFIGYVKRVETEEAAQQFIQDIKKLHHDATHNCSAYLIGENNRIQKANDDGEPSGTAGVPMLEVLKKQDLRDTVIVVTRYFGGIKLGAGGLIRAYGNTTSLALHQTGIVQRILMQGFIVESDYGLIGKIENELIHSEYVLDKIDYQEKAYFYIFVKTDDIEHFKNWLINMTNDQVSIEQIEQKFMEIPYST